ncbi:MAG: ABC transporter substrate-binding protein [Microbacterium sp. 14-71-5]|uniref:ABC transporter family substrate-binding protein n=1 Tax=Microbacterium sp. 13-71-7 TaxID=1970399 RepID=UPI000BD01FFB|nr:ABC transporter family substrate-binding protein [Microbacterium sp. 13-71-7]OZB82132.1 MAG: ABC transporter substrate-binding protein [Microbacterium sp. 13-71-7]OZB87501.1 MAG: ABC transporter substrate-binding protein [Microbacterium sp. 14-71-5]
MKKQHKLWGVVALGGALAIAISGCSASSNTGSGNADKPSTTKTADYNPQPRENLKQGGEAHFWTAEVPPQMNSFSGDASADTSRLAAWYMPQVFLMDPDGTVKANPAYIDKWDTSAKDGKTVVTIKVNDKAVWNDGTPIDWTAFETTWKDNNGSNPDFKANATDGYKDIESVTKGATDKDVIVTFNREFAWPAMPFLTGILHPKVNTPELYNDAFNGNAHPEWGAGPYKLTNYDVNGQKVTFEPNEKWWGDKPMLDKVTFSGMDRAASLNAYKNGELDQVETGSADAVKQVQGVKDTVIRRAQQTAKTIVMLDGDKPQLKDPKVRQAFFSAIDIDQQKKIAWNGLNYTEPTAGSLTLYSFQKGYEDTFKAAGLKFDVAAAKKLLDDAGWKAGSDGIREKDGVKLSVTYPVFSDSPVQAALAKALQQQEKAVGIDLKIETRPSANFSTDLTTKNWDAVSLRFTDSDPFGPAWFCQMYCSDSQLNLSGTSTKAIDDKIKSDVESQTTAEAWTAAAMKLEPEIIKETWGVIPLYNGPEIMAVKKGLANLTPETYVGLDLYGVQPVENVGWEK